MEGAKEKGSEISFRFRVYSKKREKCYAEGACKKKLNSSSNPPTKHPPCVSLGKFFKHRMKRNAYHIT